MSNAVDIKLPYAFGHGLGQFLYRMNPNLDDAGLKNAVSEFLDTIPVYFPSENWHRQLYEGVKAGFDFEAMGRQLL